MRLLLCGVLVSWTGFAAAADRPNVVILFADDLGWTDLGCYGSDYYETPNIDRLASESVRFTQAYSACTVCSPSRAALLTGKYPARLRVTDWIPGHERTDVLLRAPDWTQHLPREETTLAEALKAAGYRTAHVGKWHLGGQEFYPEQHGFDVNIGGTEWGQPPSYFWPYKNRNRDINLAERGEEGEYLTDRLTDEAERLLEQWRDEPFFLYMSYYTVHTPIESKEEYEAAFEQKEKGARHHNAAYAAMVRSLDESVGRILDKIESLDLEQKTIVLFTSDNGGLSHVRGNYVGITRNDPLRAGKGSVYEGGVRVPFMLRAPGVATLGSASDAPVCGIDVFPTVLSLAGVPEETVVDGVDLSLLLSDPSRGLDREALFWHYPHYHPGGATPYGAVRSGEWRLVEFFEDGRLELYNVHRDIGEQRNLADDMPDRTAGLHQQLKDWRASVAAQMPVSIDGN